MRELANKTDLVQAKNLEKTLNQIKEGFTGNFSNFNITGLKPQDIEQLGATIKDILLKQFPQYQFDLENLTFKPITNLFQSSDLHAGGYKHTESKRSNTITVKNALSRLTGLGTTLSDPDKTSFIDTKILSALQNDQQVLEKFFNDLNADATKERREYAQIYKLPQLQITYPWMKNTKGNHYAQRY